MKRLYSISLEIHLPDRVRMAETECISSEEINEVGAA